MFRNDARARTCSIFIHSACLTGSCADHKEQSLFVLPLMVMRRDRIERGRCFVPAAAAVFWLSPLAAARASNQCDADQVQKLSPQPTAESISVLSGDLAPAG